MAASVSLSFQPKEFSPTPHRQGPDLLPSSLFLTQHRVGLSCEAIPSPATRGHPLGRWSTSVGGREGRGHFSPHLPHRGLPWSNPASVDFSSIPDSICFFSYTGPLMSEHACSLLHLENSYSNINSQFKVSSPLIHYFGSPAPCPSLHPSVDHTELCVHVHLDLLQQRLRQGRGQATWLGS